MIPSVNDLRRALTRLLYSAMGLRIDHWRHQVERLWLASKQERRRFLESLLLDQPPVGAADTEIKSLDALTRAPVLTKDRLREQSKSLPDSQKTFARHTAGTTGNPTEVWLSKDELGRMLAIRDYCLRHYGIRLGDREARLWGRPQAGVKAAVKDFLMNRQVFNPVGEAASAELDKMLAYNPVYIYGYSSLILEAARLIEEHGLVVPPLKAVVCTAETILPSQKRYIGQQFSCPVVEEYGSTEFDIVAFECRRGHRHLVNPWIIAEQQDDRLVLTDVSRKTQSLVRYNLGDIVALRDSGCSVLGGNAYLLAIEGRSINRFAYVTPSKKFHAVEFARALDRFFEQSHFQFRFRVEQHEYNKFVLMVPAGVRVDREVLRKHIKVYIESSTGYVIEVACGELQSDEKTHYFLDKRTAADDN